MTVNIMEQKKTGPREVFLQLLAIIFLYVCVISFGILVFQMIDFAFPDVLVREAPRFAREGMRWPIAILIIVFPFFLWVTSYLQKDLMTYPEKRELKTRKWLLYLTLFIATLVIVGDMVGVIFTFLNGELTIRFLLKVLTVLVIALAVFVYYLWNVRKSEPPSADPHMKIFVRGIAILGGIFIVGGLVIAGSPQSERLRRFDDERISDLSGIQSQLVDYWRTKGTLPDTLEALRDPLQGFVPPHDPATGGDYEYRKTGDRAFELCANFQTSSKGKTAQEAIPARPGVFGMEEIWSHEAGHTCFSRSIDPDRFPPRKAKPTS